MSLLFLFLFPFCFLFVFFLFFQNGKIKISFKRHNFCFYFHSTFIVLISFLPNIGKEMSRPGFRKKLFFEHA